MPIQSHPPSNKQDGEEQLKIHHQVAILEMEKGKEKMRMRIRKLQIR